MTSTTPPSVDSAAESPRPHPAGASGPRVHIFSVAPNPRYFQALMWLVERGQLSSVQLHSLRVLRPVLKGGMQRLGLLRDRPREPLDLSTAVRRVAAHRHLLDADVVIIALEPYDLRVGYFLAVSAYLRQRGVAVLYHTSWPDWDSDWQPRHALPGARRVWRRFLRGVTAVCVSGAAQRALRGRASRAVRIPHAVDSELLRPREGRAPDRSLPFRWISVARLEPGKGLRALVELFRERHSDQVHLTVVGDGPLRSELEARAVGAPVEILAFDAAALPERLRRHDGFVLNSHRHGRWEELFGITILEAMACGLPVVVTDCLGPREIVRHEESGLLVPQQDSVALRGALERVQSDPALRQRLAAAGRREVERRYALGRVAEQWLGALGVASCRDREEELP